MLKRPLQPEIWFLIFFLGALSFGIAVWTSSHKSPHKQEIGQTDQPAKGGSPAVATKKSADERIAEYTWWVAFYTLALAVSTIGLWTVTWLTGRRQSKELRIVQRAYVSVLPGGIERYADGSYHYACNVIFHNAGNLPARNVSWSVNKMMSQNRAEEPPTISHTAGSIVIPPRGDVTKGDGKGLAQDEILTNLENGKQWLYIYGLVRYHDGFSTDRWTHFCHRYFVSPNLADLGPSRGRHHEKGNHTEQG